MELGKKIKQIRVSKNMTQAELAGDKITRNMLSQIENGSATPSVGTIIYIAEKLEMPAGYFLSEPENDFVYKKMLSIEAIKKAYREGDYKKCLEICGSALTETDDEIDLILCECYFRTGKEHFSQGKLISAHKAFNTSLHYAEKTVYNVSWICASCYVYLEFIGLLSPALRFETKEEYESDAAFTVCSDMYTYIKARKYADEKNFEEANKLISFAPFSVSPFAKHIKAKLEMQKENYASAYDILYALTESKESDKLGKAVLYMLYSDLEVCCRELKDFENAYTYATQKSNMLSETGI